MAGICSNKGITSSGESANWGGAARGGRTEAESGQLEAGPEMEGVEVSKHMVTPLLDWLRGRVRVVV